MVVDDLNYGTTPKADLIWPDGPLNGIDTWEVIHDSWRVSPAKKSEPVFVNVYGAQESIPRHQFR